MKPGNIIEQNHDLPVSVTDKEQETIDGAIDSKPTELLRYIGSAPAQVVESALLETVGQLRLALLAIDPSKADQTSITTTRERASTLQGMLIRKLGPIVDSMRPIQECTLRPSHAISRSVLVDLYDLACKSGVWDLDDQSADALGITLLSETIQTMEIIRTACIGDAGEHVSRDR